MFNSQLIEKFKNYPTPFYYYDLGILQENLKELKKVSSGFGYTVHYALKANADERILKLINEYGFGADCVSGNEVKRALEIGFPKDKIVFAGVGKTDPEIKFAIKSEIQCINCESLEEIEVVNGLSEEMEKITPIALRLNPSLDAKTHAYISTGLEENKFGIALSEVKKVLDDLDRFRNLKLGGLHFHIGSQIDDLKVFKELCLKVNEIQKALKKQHIQIEHLNLGGGLGVNYQNPEENLVSDFNHYFRVFHRYLRPYPNQTVHFELGRSIVAQCGTLISRVLYIKKGVKTQFVILDAGMTELIRPALYQSFHKIENLSNNKGTQKYDVVGPVCESADFFGKGVFLAETQRGDLIAIRTIGAYGEVMASRYNLRDPAKVVYSDCV
jgi:diaminopimelate decarboxylase